ncbi:GNAT family N-acetyltransferase [Streptomyces sp. NBC_01340]|uniref:GNAT family N-acetyltransferase n=1 Tax=unclassified Streptomyces TaxID=2593676 RepID=UPI00225BF487|nr:MULTISPECIES: GNAT family N-acetyltransferase [unclassified Streptomyces]MCX4452551.1 GNAT family N-acetyltransferase [Streptomyces sp. NBC_01719]MCX4491911.1 GNAT family N-acetyltransferase [Streptomyces sp. NBC_01728]MCX4593587.1 GNAT family N-acetyltransferase [Streptomyces sp. NBC_01549]WSI37106.1 GNAT family N-acetyltransferase [Streptomyces sp. NBC_01340]
MSTLRFQQSDDEAGLKDWRYVHNVIVPPAALSLDEVRERAGRNHLEVVYLGDVLVGCSTVRPPKDGGSTATVIARVLPEHRRQGFGEELYERGLERARALGAEMIETVVLASNEDGLRFAVRRGFVEIERYVLPGETAEWVDLRLA